MKQVASDWRKAGLDDVDSALCAFAEKLTRTPQQMEQGDIEKLRSVGLDDAAIHDATQVIGYFNYINRVADAFGLEPEPFT